MRMTKWPHEYSRVATPSHSISNVLLCSISNPSYSIPQFLDNHELPPIDALVFENESGEEKTRNCKYVMSL